MNAPIAAAIAPEAPTSGMCRRGVLEAVDEPRDDAAGKVEEKKRNPAPAVLEETADDPEKEHVSEKVPDPAVEEQVREEGVNAVHLARNEAEPVEDASFDDLALPRAELSSIRRRPHRFPRPR